MTAGRTILSDNKNWCTPHNYVESVKEFFGGTISLDPCSNRFSVVGAEVEYSKPEHDGLTESWDFPKIYVNPPYGSDRKAGTTIKQWLRRCAEAYSEYDAEVLALVPVASNTAHWKNNVWGVATAVAFLYDTRLKFLVNGESGGKGAPMSCAMIYWGQDYSRFFDLFIQYGAVVNIEHLHGVSIGPNAKSKQTLIAEVVRR